MKLISLLLALSSIPFHAAEIDSIFDVSFLLSIGVFTIITVLPSTTATIIAVLHNKGYFIIAKTSVFICTLQYHILSPPSQHVLNKDQ